MAYPGGGYPPRQPSASPYAAAGSTPVAAAGSGEDEYKTLVELNISCKNLENRDLLSKSDPCCCVDLVSKDHRGQDVFQELGRTEIIWDNLSPQFSKSIVMDYFFEQMQTLHFIVYDVDDKDKPLRRGGGEQLGAVTTSLGQIVSQGSLTLKLSRPTGGSGQKFTGHITIRAEEVSSADEKLDMRWYAQNVDKMDFFGKSDPYLQFSRVNPDGTYSVVHRTEVVKNTLNPSWRPFKLTARKLCNADLNRTIRVECYDWDRDGSSDFIGQCELTLNKMKTGGFPHKIELINPAKAAKKKSYRNSGVLVLESLTFTRIYSFLDYISHGCELNFVVGIDFTGSNGDPRTPQSLHNITSGTLNEYQRALWSVGSICEQYDTDKLFPAFGFGAKLPPRQEFSNIFALNFNEHSPSCAGIGGIMEAYQNCIYQVKLWGPTNAAPIINRVADMAGEEHQRVMSLRTKPRMAEKYFVLLLLTDGVLTDMEQTKKAVIRSSHYPMSIIIVGVGGADFSDMDVLDSDDELLTSGRNKALRDIVQFVPFRKFAMASPAALAKEVLAEIPGQLVEYMQTHELQPPAL